VAVNSGLVTYPEAFDKAWSAGGVTVWTPRAPSAYVALGCVATTGPEPPSLTTVVCVHRQVTIEAPLGQCLFFQSEPEDAGTNPAQGCSRQLLLFFLG
jgi:hypothetical protein